MQSCAGASRPLNAYVLFALALLIFGLIVGLFSTSSAGASLEQAAPIAVILNGLRNFIQQVGVGLIVDALFRYVARFFQHHG